MKIIAIIPARYDSIRFPGKPLADIHGKPMIWWVYKQAVKVKEFTDVYIATDSEKIMNVCNELGMKSIVTSDRHKTGTDRVGEAASKLSADLYVNIQGDEPLIEPMNILKAIKPFYNDVNLQITNLMTKIKNPVDVLNCTVPKVITNKDGIGIYLTRSMSPYPKGRLDYDFYKQVCVYGFKPEALKFFCNTPRGEVETIEDIEILRFIENGYRVQFIKVISESIAVDTQNDLDRVRVMMSKG